MARIIVVEDNPANLKLATLLLSRAGHAVLGAADAEAGLALAASESPDLILMDIQLPGMDGLTATSLLKANPGTANIPVIALTAMAMKSDQEKSRLAGCDGYITKPLRYQQLYAAIDELLSRSARTAPTESFSFTGEHSSGPDAGDSTDRRSLALDVSVLEDLVGNERSVLLDFLDMFQSSTAQIAGELIAACSNREALVAGAQAHKLKSSARAVGAIALGQLCSLLEAAGGANDMEALARLQPDFEAELHAVNTAIDALRQAWMPLPTESGSPVGKSQKLDAND